MLGGFKNSLPLFARILIWEVVLGGTNAASYAFGMRGGDPFFFLTSRSPQTNESTPLGANIQSVKPTEVEDPSS